MRFHFSLSIFIVTIYRWFACFAMGDYRYGSSVTDLLSKLKWDSLESCRLPFQLKYIHKMFTNQVALDPNTFFSPGTYLSSRNSNSLKIMTKFGRLDVVKSSFFYSIIPVWNSLPDTTVTQTNSESFPAYIVITLANF